MKGHSQTQHLAFKSKPKHRLKINPTSSESSSIKPSIQASSKKKRSIQKSHSKDHHSREKLVLKITTVNQMPKNEQDTKIEQARKQSSKSTPFCETSRLNGKLESPSLQSSEGKRKVSHSKGGLCFGRMGEKQKDRKFSENTHDSLNGYQDLRSEHLLEEKVLGRGLNEKELHRLRKIYAVQEAHYAQNAFKSGELSQVV